MSDQIQSLQQENQIISNEANELTAKLMLQISKTQDLQRDNESLRKICGIQDREIQSCHNELNSYVKLPFGLFFYKGEA